MSWPAYDREVLPYGAKAILPPGLVAYSLPSEDKAIPSDVWTKGAAEQRDAFWDRVLRDRCAARETLQIANGGKSEPDEICRPQLSK